MSQYLDIFIHAHPDDIELFMGMTAKRAIENGHHIIMLLATTGDGGAKHRLLESNTGKITRYHENRLIAHDEAIKYLLNTKQNATTHCELIGGHILTYETFNHQVWSYNLKLPDGYRGVGFESNQFETLEKLYKGDISSIHAIDGNHYHSLDDLKSTIQHLLLTHTKTHQHITFHIPEYDEEQNKGAHSDHFYVSRLMNDIIKSGVFGAVSINMYSDYINGTKPINLNADDEKFHLALNKVIDDILIEHGRNENVRTIHSTFLGKEYVTNRFTIS